MEKPSRLLIQKLEPNRIRDFYALLETVDLPTDGISDHLDHFFVAMDGDNIVGGIGIEIYDTIGLLRSAGVAKEFQGSGIGTQLVRKIHEYAKENHLEKIFLFTETAEKFFAHQFGYKHISRNEVDDSLRASAEFKICESAPTMLKLL
ncbi:MAG: GNAT family N-acetyltransferase [Candidatus Kariarchaeaceae archaeon]|jgi:amino-acid N-acetyltransferase